MKEIHVSVSDTIKVTDKVATLKQPLEQIRLARMNGEKVIHSVTSMERSLARIVMHFAQREPRQVAVPGEGIALVGGARAP